MVLAFGLLFASALSAVCTEPGPDASCDGGLKNTDIQGVWTSFWSGLQKGNAEEAASLCASNFAATLNGGPDPVTWNKFSFLQDLLSKTKFQAMRVVALPVAVSKNAAVFAYEATFSVPKTGEVFSFGPFSTKITITDDKKLLGLDSVGPAAGESALLAATESARPSLLKAKVDKLLKAWGEKDTATIIASYAENFGMTRNGKPDVQPWRNPEFIDYLLKMGTMKYEVYNWAFSSVGSLHMHLLATYTVAKSGEKIVYYDSWLVSFSPDGKISAISSIVDSSALLALMEAHPLALPGAKQEL